MIVYLDVIILENFLVNLFLLDITLKTIKIRCALWKKILASFLGSLYVLVMFIPELKFFKTSITNIFIAFLVISICISNRNVYTYIKSTIIYIFYSMLLAGLTFYLSLSTGSEGHLNNSLIQFKYKKLFLSMIIIYMIINRLLIYIKDRKILSKYIYNINISVANKNINFKGFLDTGNELREPLTNLPVIIVEKDLLQDLNLKDYTTYNVGYSVISGDNGNLQGFKPDNIYIIMDDKVILKEAILVGCDNKLSKNNDYKALLPRGILI